MISNNGLSIYMIFTLYQIGLGCVLYTRENIHAKKSLLMNGVDIKQCFYVTALIKVSFSLENFGLVHNLAVKRELTERADVRSRGVSEISLILLFFYITL